MYNTFPFDQLLILSSFLGQPNWFWSTTLSYDILVLCCPLFIYLFIIIIIIIIFTVWPLLKQPFDKSNKIIFIISHFDVMLLLLMTSLVHMVIPLKSGNNFTICDVGG